MRRPIYRLTIDEGDEGMDFIGLVDAPAHGKNYITMSKAPKTVEPKFHFNGEKQIVTGVAIATDLLIYRVDPDGFEYDVYFAKEDTLKLMQMFAKRGYHNNVNLMHDMSQKVDDTYMIESYFINDKRTNIPEEFADQNLRAGSLIFSYWVEGAKTWEFIKENGAGFSLEGWFKEIEVKFVKKRKQMKNKKSLLERLGFKAEKPTFDKDNKDKYAESTDLDGNTVMWEGELAVGEPLFIIGEDGEAVLYPEGDTSFEVDGVLMVVTVDNAGLISNIVEAEELDEDEDKEKESSHPCDCEEAMIAMQKDYEKKFAALTKAKDTEIKTIAKDVDELRTFVEDLADKKPPKKVNNGTDDTPQWRKIKNNKNKKTN